MVESTIDGHRPEPGQRTTLYGKYGTAFTGEPHHYGSEHGWQIEQWGPHISELYFDRVKALKAHRAEVAALLASIDDAIKDAGITPRSKCSNPDCAQCDF
jgi:hypothetical protein